ncbi:MAG: HAD-IC family P-type ATPase [Campylobacterota bacterium]|nr:HAD-IC family P-type ATPase [Campylobacterota bacterium]
MHYHTKPIEKTLEHLEANHNGLSSKEAKKRILHFGKNTLPIETKKTVADIFLEQFKSPIIYILLIASVVSFAIKEFTDGFFIVAILIINAIIGTYQEYTAEEKADGLKKSVKTYVNTLRDNNITRINSELITIGDILYFETGSKIPADCRLLETTQLSVDESLLTGESVNVTKDALFLSDDQDLTIGDRYNMLHAGSYVTKGRAKAVVTSIAKDTQIGTIASLLAESKDPKPPLIKRMEGFSLNIAKAIGVVIVLFILWGVYYQFGLKEIFFVSVALAVSSIPEGLPVAITIALSSASIIMSKKNVIVRKLSAIEGLGSCTFIASDKTGTLTKNILSVDSFVTINCISEDSVKKNKDILNGFILCNESSYIKKDKDYEFLGDQVDIAFLRYAIEVDENSLNIKEKAVINEIIPYESQKAYCASSHLIDNKNIQYIKGSVETIIEYCDLDNEQKQAVLEQNSSLAADGFKNIAIAYKNSSTKNIVLEDFKYLGTAAFVDPLRDDTKEAVQKAQQAGIDVAIVTGDHPNTAYYIAKKLGVAIDKDEIITGEEIEKWIQNGENEKLIEHKRVFARVSPEHKQKIVTAFQRLGHFVAVTGDGVNDAPALKYADIGISMGKCGTDAARQSSDMILTDDSFSSIVNGIKEGRVAYDNIRKVIYLLISTGFAEIVLIILAMLFHLPLALLPVQLLWLNLVTNGIQDVALGLEKAESDVLKRKPRAPKEPIFNKLMISRVLVGGLYMGITAFIVFFTLINSGYSEDSARNITLLLMVLFENVHVFNSRTEKQSIFKINHLKNKFLLLSVIAAQLIHIVSMYIPFMQSLLDIQPVSLSMWLILFSIALILVAVMELEKKLFKGFR